MSRYIYLMDKGEFARIIRDCNGRAAVWKSVYDHCVENNFPYLEKLEVLNREMSKDSMLVW